MHLGFWEANEQRPIIGGVGHLHPSKMDRTTHMAKVRIKGLDRQLHSTMFLGAFELEHTAVDLQQLNVRCEQLQFARYFLLPARAFFPGVVDTPYRRKQLDLFDEGFLCQQGVESERDVPIGDHNVDTLFRLFEAEDSALDT